MGCKNPLILSIMKANELRIGNYVYSYNGSVIKWGLEHFALINDGVTIEHIKPIELTEEIFSKLHVKQGNFEICYNEGKFYLCEESDPNYSYCIGLPNIKHLHQLQNLYWCLCGKELNVQL